MSSPIRSYGKHRKQSVLDEARRIREWKNINGYTSNNNGSSNSDPPKGIILPPLPPPTAHFNLSNGAKGTITGGVEAGSRPDEKVLSPSHKGRDNYRKSKPTDPSQPYAEDRSYVEKKNNKSKEERHSSTFRRKLFAKRTADKTTKMLSLPVKEEKAGKAKQKQQQLQQVRITPRQELEPTTMKNISSDEGSFRKSKIASHSNSESSNGSIRSSLASRRTTTESSYESEKLIPSKNSSTSINTILSKRSSSSSNGGESISRPSSLSSASSTADLAPTSKRDLHLSQQESEAWGFFDDVMGRNSPPTNKRKRLLEVDFHLNSDSDSDLEESGHHHHHNRHPAKQHQLSVIAGSGSTKTSTAELPLSPPQPPSTEQMSISPIHSSASTAPSPSRQTRRLTPHITTKRTYATSSRRYMPINDHEEGDIHLSDRDHGVTSVGLEHGLDFVLGLDFSSRNNDSLVEEQVDEDVDLKNFDELRAHGMNTHFIDDVQFIMDGLRLANETNNVNLKRSTILDMASKSLDSDFIKGFKSTNFPVILFGYMKNEPSDVFTDFLFGVILCRLLEEGSVGTASSILQNPWIIGMLISMLADQEDIRSKQKNQEQPEAQIQQKKSFSKIKSSLRLKRSKLSFSSTSKKSPFQDSLAALVDKMESPLAINSRSLVALSAFISMRKLGPKVAEMLVNELLIHIPDFLRLANDLMKKLLEKSDEDKKYEEYRLQLLYMVLAQLEFLADGDEMANVLQVIDNGEEQQPILRTLWIAESYMKGDKSNRVVSRFRNLTVIILRILISITTNATVDTNESVSQLYDPDLAETLVDFVSGRHNNNNDNDNGKRNRDNNEFNLNDKLSELPLSSKLHTQLQPESNTTVSDDIFLYAAGLLVNLVAGSTTVYERLLTEPTLSTLKSDAFMNISKETSNNDKTELHIQGCQFLALGLLASSKSARQLHFTSDEVEKIGQGLTNFEGKLMNQWGQGLQHQISAVQASLRD